MSAGPIAGERDFIERRWRSRDGLSLYCRDYPAGDGPPRLPVVCLHGLTRNSADFEHLAPAIAAMGRRVIVPDVRGRGESQWDSEPAHYTPRTYGRDVIELLDALGIARAVFVGTSMGGIIMMMLAPRHRGRIGGAVLNDVGPEVAPEGLRRIQAYVGKPVELASWPDAVAYVRNLYESTLPDLDDAGWERMTERSYILSGERPVARYDPAIAIPLAEGKAKAPAIIAWALYRRLAKACPTLVVRGAQSDILSAATAKKMVANRDKAELVEIPGVGHAPTLDEPASRRALEAFLSRVP